MARRSLRYGKAPKPMSLLGAGDEPSAPQHTMSTVAIGKWPVYVDLSRPVCANTGRSPRVGRTGQIDPLLPFNVGLMNGREARESGVWPSGQAFFTVPAGPRADVCHDLHCRSGLLLRTGVRINGALENTLREVGAEANCPAPIDMASAARPRPSARTGRARRTGHREVLVRRGVAVTLQSVDIDAISDRSPLRRRRVQAPH
jgi:hypothetical protein